MQSRSTNIITSPITLPPQPPGTEGYNTAVPGKLKWFEPGSEDYTKWVSQRSEFIKEID